MAGSLHHNPFNNDRYIITQCCLKANSNLLKYENVFYNVTIPANNTTVFNVSGFSGKGSTVACIANTPYDLIQANGHMNGDNTFMRVTATNIHTDEQTINVSAIRLYI